MRGRVEDSLLVPPFSPLPLSAVMECVAREETRLELTAVGWVGEVLGGGNVLDKDTTSDDEDTVEVAVGTTMDDED